MACGELKIIIEQELARRGMSLRELAEQANMSASGLSSLLNETNKEPRLSTLAALALALNMPLRDLIEASGFPVVEVTTSAEEARVAAVVRSVPDLAPFLEHLSVLTPDDRAAVFAVAEVLARRQTGPPDFHAE